MADPEKDLAGAWSDGSEIYEFSGHRVTLTDADDPDDREQGTWRATDNLLTMDFEGDEESYRYKVQGDQLTLTDEDGDFEVYQRVTGPGKGKGTTTGDEHRQKPDTGGQLDPLLIGIWRKTDSFADQGVSMVVDTWLVVNQDGTYRYGDSKAVGGGYGFDATLEGGDDVSIGKWRVRNGVIEFMEQGMRQWAPLASYYVEGNSLMFTGADGSREVWTRAG